MNLKERMKISSIGRENKNYKKTLRKNKIISILTEFVKNNIKEYFIITLIFLIGIFLGVMFINNTTYEQKMEISSYVNTYIEAFKGRTVNNDLELFRNNLRDNLSLAIIMWFVGNTLVGVPIILGIIVFRGFCLGYTISAITAVLGVSKGIGFTAISIVMQNLLFIPSIISLGVSSLKIYKSILNDKRKENIKIELIRHTVFCGIVILTLVLSAMVETQISTNLLRTLIKYF